MKKEAVNWRPRSPRTTKDELPRRPRRPRRPRFRACFNRYTAASPVVLRTPSRSPPLEPRAYYEWSLVELPMIGVASIGATKLSLAVGGMSLPSYSDSAKVAYVLYVRNDHIVIKAHPFDAGGRPGLFFAIALVFPADGFCTVAVSVVVADGKKGLVSSVIYCTKPMEDKNREMVSWEKFLQDRIKVAGGKAGNLGESFTIMHDKGKVIVTYNSNFSKRNIEFCSN